MQNNCRPIQNQANFWWQNVRYGFFSMVCIEFPIYTGSVYVETMAQDFSYLLREKNMVPASWDSIL